jgi:hypothetical protein
MVLFPQIMNQNYFNRMKICIGTLKNFLFYFRRYLIGILHVLRKITEKAKEGACVGSWVTNLILIITLDAGGNPQLPQHDIVEAEVGIR